MGDQPFIVRISAIAGDLPQLVVEGVEGVAARRLNQPSMPRILTRSWRSAAPAKASWMRPMCSSQPRPWSRRAIVAVPSIQL